MEGLTRVCREDVRDVVPLTRVVGHLEAHTPFFSSELSLTLRAERFFFVPVQGESSGDPPTHHHARFITVANSGA